MHKSIAKIVDTYLGAGEHSHGVFTATLTVDYGGTGQTIGGYNLSGDTGFAGAFIRRVLDVAGVDRWEQLKGRTILVLHEDDRPESRVVGIENLPTERGGQLVFETLCAEYQARR
jgi:hypothetical protein